MRKNALGKSIWVAVGFAMMAPLLVYSYDACPEYTPPPLTGPPPGYTAGFGEPICLECHTSYPPVNSGRGAVKITVSSSSGAVTSYSSGAAYQVTVNVSDPTSTQHKWGFELSARTYPGGTQAGTITVGADGFTQILPSRNDIQYIAHTCAGNRDGTKSGVNFIFNWTAPNVSAGEIVFNAAGNAANGDHTPLGDYIYDTFLTLQPRAPAPPPSINSGGIVNNASYTLTSSSVAPGSLASIFGFNLSDGTVCVPEGCGPTFDSSGKVIPTLDGAQVTFNGIAAPILSTPNSGQLNVQVPVELAGAAFATVQVTVNAQSSAPSTVSLTPLAPGLISIDSSGGGQGAILNDKDANVGIKSLVAPALSWSASHPAAAGDVIEIYGTGLGAVTPQTPTGMKPSGTPQTAPVSVTIGGIPAPGAFSSLASCCVGLNQVNVRVPPGVAPGNAVPVVLTIGGVKSNTVTIAVGP